MDKNNSSVLSLPIERYCLYTFSIIISICGIVGNTAIVITICRYPQLRKNCRYLQAALAAGDSVVCLGQIINSIVFIIIPNLALRIIRWQCLMLNTSGAASIIYSVILTLFISADRCYAILWPVKYFHSDKQRTFVFCMTSALLVTLTCTVATYLDVNLYDYPEGCVGASSRSPRLNLLINYICTACGSMVAFVYPVTLITMKIKCRQMAKRQNETEDGVPFGFYFQKQVEASASIICVIGATLVLYIIPSTITLIMSKLQIYPNYIRIAQSYVGTGLSINATVNFLFYVWKDPLMRDKLKHMLPCYDENAVMPISLSMAKFPAKEK